MGIFIKPKYFVVGASGYIGNVLLCQAKLTGVGIGTSSKGNNEILPLDLASPGSFDFDSISQSDIIFLTAAISAPDICASENARAWSVNVTGTSEFITKVLARGAKVIFFSSDTVYGERKFTFDESALIQPAGEYAEMKYELERVFLGNPHFKSIRLSYVFSKEDKFTKYLSGCANRGDEAELFHPFYRAVVHRDDVVDGALALALRWDEFPQQVINFGGPKVLSRIDIANTLKSVSLPNLKYRVTEPEAEFFKNRPRVIAMSSNVLPLLLGRPTRTLAQAAKLEFA